MQLEFEDYHNIISDNWIDSYEKDKFLLWQDIQSIAANTHILKTLFGFPFYELLGSMPPFWQILKYNYYHHTLLIIAKLIEQSGDCLSLRSLKTGIRINVKNSKIGGDFENDLKILNFDKKVARIERKVLELRNNKIAHYIKNWNSQHSIVQLNMVAPKISEIDSITQEICKLYNYLCFNEKYTMDIRMILQQDIDYVDHLLSDLASKGRVLNMPEKEPDLWLEHKQQLEPNNFTIINEWRVKFGLPVLAP